jgi:hypothetical protein
MMDKVKKICNNIGILIENCSVSIDL